MRDALAVLRSEGSLTNAKIRVAIQYVLRGKMYFSARHNFVQAFLQPHKLATSFGTTRVKHVQHMHFVI